MATITEKLTKFRVSRGLIGGVDKFCTFTYVGPCEQEDCPVYKVCTYDKKGICLAKKMYLIAAFGPMERLMSKAKDPGIISHWVGQLLSAYLKLAKFEIKEMSLRDPVYTTVKGDLKPHPIYDLLQKQQRLVVDLWFKSGMLDMAKSAGLMDTNQLMPEIDDIVQQQNGQAGYYDAMLTVPEVSGMTETGEIAIEETEDDEEEKEKKEQLRKKKIIKPEGIVKPKGPVENMVGAKIYNDDDDFYEDDRIDDDDDEAEIEADDGSPWWEDKAWKKG